MLLSEYHWLILSLPALWLVWYFRPLSIRLLVLRVLVIVLVILALSGLQLRLPGREGVIVVVADRSLSMPTVADQRINESMLLLKNEMPPGARLGLVTFAEEARVEMAPTRSAFSGFTGDLSRTASRLDEGVRRALAMMPTDMPGRVLVISDGLWSGVDPRLAAFQAAGRNIPIDFRWLARDLSGDMAITSFAVPGILNPGEAFIANAEVFSPVEQQAQVALFSDETQIASYPRRLKAGNNSMVFSLLAPQAAVIKFRLHVTPAGPDPVAENNEARAISEIIGKKPVLVIAGQHSAMFSLLQKSGARVELVEPQKIAWSIEYLAGFSAVVIENVAAGSITMHGMQMLSAWVRHLGGGLVITGGKNSYGNGGYYQSPLEPVMPVSLELRSQHRKLALALMVVLDRSGSMAAPVRGDRTKMDLANIAAANAFDLLSPFDEFGLLAVDTEPHVIVPLQRLQEKARWREQILRVESSGGGIYVYSGVSKAVEMLLGAEAQTRHIILFADASDSEEPGRYWELLDKATGAGLTLSVIGLGTEGDSDANLLKKIAAAGKGRIFFTREPEELPRLFSQDTFVAARSTFIEADTQIESLTASNRFTGKEISFKSALGAYNLCYVKPEAFLAVRTVDENAAPVLAAWQIGLGRVACYTGVADGEQAGRFAAEPAAASLLTGVCNWVAFDDRFNLGEMTITPQISNGVWRAEISLDPEREREPFRENPDIDILRSSEGLASEKTTMQMQWVSADSLAAEVIVHGDEVIAGVIRSGKLQKRLNPVCQPYCPEFAPARHRDGLGELKDLAAISGGREVIDLGQAWVSMPARIQFRDLSGGLLFLALLLFVLEVAERRTAFLGLLLDAIKRRKTHVAPVIADSSQVAGDSAVKNTGQPAVAANTPQALIRPSDQPDAPVVPTQQLPAPDKGFAGALKTAKKQAGKRTR
ncbi:MAG TPA: VWA domain-containing protein [Candidatus Rifleibacterium sp.]|nr:VWA domain-containing protein [Candidatus Rifleibacterium sp.]HPT46357.1 VWA domain-containing protein [Candidatus Rifleibacterium sp.]